MSEWAGEVIDWIQLMAQGPPRKDEVTFQMLTMMRQPAEKKNRERRRRTDEETKRPGPPLYKSEEAGAGNQERQ